VVQCPEHAGRARARITRAREGGAEVAHVGGDLVLVNQGQVMERAGARSEALAAVVLGGRCYEIGDAGVAVSD
jgi:hypothetical protein